MKAIVYINEMRDVVRRFKKYDMTNRKVLYDYYDGELTGMKYLSWKDDNLTSDDCLEITKVHDELQDELRRLRHESKSI